MTRVTTHPHWCGRNHLCSIGAGAGEHRSEPLTVDAPCGRIVATRTQHRSGRNGLELRVRLDLPVDQTEARTAAQQLVTRIHDALSIAPVGAR